MDNSDSANPLTWECRPCPYGGFCQGITKWYDVRAKFGYFRVHERTETPPACLLDEDRVDDAEPTCAFARCLHPPACLGASNDEFKHHYHEPATGIDLSQVEFDLNQSSGLLESCDVESGYKNDNGHCGTSTNMTNGTECKRYRLCGTCRVGYKRASMASARCKKCPTSANNKLFLAIGFFVMVAGLSLLVYLTIKGNKKGSKSEAGKKLSAFKKMLMNFMQLVALAASMPLQWVRNVSFRG